MCARAPSGRYDVPAASAKKKSCLDLNRGTRRSSAAVASVTTGAMINTPMANDGRKPMPCATLRVKCCGARTLPPKNPTPTDDSKPSGRFWITLARFARCDAHVQAKQGSGNGSVRCENKREVRAGARRHG